MSAIKSKQALFKNIIVEAAHCNRCPAMCERTAVLSDLNGSVAARIMFIGEAPGRKGADQTRVPFSGDQSGKNFDRFLASIGLSRAQIFITSAALCNPRAESGANRKPSKAELANCSNFLRRTVALLDPAMVVTLGSVALEALKAIEPHDLKLKESAAKIHSWNGRVLVPIYHPSPQVLASHRREAEQLRDYKVVAKAITSRGLTRTNANQILVRTACGSGRTSIPGPPATAGGSDSL
ncbi:MAG TPA: uracil-DNA glycosylase [Pyrinomonadaceae bacterium]|jgi:DNA polymerase|nr:uracil-DNA glycosylase [Pyrinomonadaceae bacterium]